MAYNRLSLAEKLLTKTQLSENGECLIWTGQKDKKGYGRIKTNGRLRLAHRVMYEVHCGPIPDGMVVMHLCDTPACVGLAHLQLGTQLENVQDMLSKGRANKAKGERHPQAKLTDAQRSEIRRRFVPYDRKNGTRALAKEFGVTHQSISETVSTK